MSYILRHNLTGVALDFITTSYLFHKSFGQYGEYEAHFKVITVLTILEQRDVV